MDCLLPVFGTRIKSMEILSLINGIKPAVRQGFYEEELPEVDEFCRKNKLFLVKSEFKVVIDDADKPFSNKGMRADPEDKRKGMFFVYISKDELIAYKAAYYEINNDNKNLGLILGYPKCCSLFFSELFPKISKLDNDYALPALEKSKGNNFSFYTNVFLREKDYCLISHFPCNYNCSESISIGKNNLELLRKDNKKTADEFISSLKAKIKINNREVSFS